MANKKTIIAALLGVCFLSHSGVALARGKFFNLFHGSFENRYRLRTTGSDQGQDVYSLFSLDIGDSTYQKFTGSLQAVGIFDLDRDQGGTFRSVYDTFSSNTVGGLYYAYLDIQKISPVELIRVGRQHNYDFESFYFDGITVDSSPFYGFRLSAYGGVPVHIYENQFGWETGDWLAGGALSWTPIRALRVRFDYAHLKDDTAGFRATAADQADDLFGATVWADVTKHLDATAKLTSFSDQLRDASFAATYSFDKLDMRITARGFRLLEGYAIRVLDLDAYSIAGTYQPYTEVGLGITKNFGRHYSADGGFSWRWLDDNQTVSAFNHGFMRGYLAFSTYDVPLKGLSLSATGDYYNGRDNILRDDFFGGSFSATQSLFKKRLKFTGGTAYYLYRFNYATANESHNVQTYFARAEVNPIKPLRARAGYEFEDNDLNGYHTLNLSLIWDF